MQAKKGCKNFVCSQPGCNKEYSTKFALKRHLITHSGKRQFACKLCDRKFALEQYLKEHEYIHTNETPYVCGIDGCSESFRQRAKLCIHRMSHKSYQKKSYRVFSRKNNKTTMRKSLKNANLKNVNQLKIGLKTESESISKTNEANLYFNNKGVEQNLHLEQLSATYCLCDTLSSLINYIQYEFKSKYITYP